MSHDRIGVTHLRNMTTGRRDIRRPVVDPWCPAGRPSFVQRRRLCGLTRYLREDDLNDPVVDPGNRAQLLPGVVKRLDLGVEQLQESAIFQLPTGAQTGGVQCCVARDPTVCCLAVTKPSGQLWRSRGLSTPVIDGPRRLARRETRVLVAAVASGNGVHDEDSRAAVTEAVDFGPAQAPMVIEKG